jgi:hypothetical protein
MLEEDVLLQWQTYWSSMVGVGLQVNGGLSSLLILITTFTAQKIHKICVGHVVY